MARRRLLGMRQTIREGSSLRFADMEGFGGALIKNPLAVYLVVLVGVVFITKGLRSGPALLILSLLIVGTALAATIQKLLARPKRTFGHPTVRDRALFVIGMPAASVVFLLPFFSDPYSDQLLLMGLDLRGPGLTDQVSLVAPVLIGLLLLASVAAGFLGNPVLLLPGLSLVFVYKEGIRYDAPSIDLAVSTTDWFLPWVALFTLIASFSILNALEECREHSTPRGKPPHELMKTLAWFSLALMVSSYFYSGVKKLLLGEHLFSWIIHNPTQYLVAHAETKGLVPIVGDAEAEIWQATLAALSFSGVVIVINALTVLTQLGALAVFAGPRLRTLLIFLLEVEHFAIFFLTGIFFYKWIAVLLLLGAILRGQKLSARLASGNIDKVFAGYGVLALGVAPILQMPILGWWDSPMLLRIERSVIPSQSLSGVPIPPSLALHYSLPIAQSRDIPNLEWIPAVFQKNSALGAVPSREASHFAREICLDPGILVPPSTLTSEKVIEVSEKIMGRLSIVPYAEDLSKSSWFPHHVWNGASSVSPFVSFGVNQISRIEEDLVVTCASERLKSSEILRVRFVH